MGFGVPYFHTNPYRDYSEQHMSEFLRSKQPTRFPTDTKSVLSKRRAHNCSDVTRYHVPCSFSMLFIVSLSVTLCFCPYNQIYRHTYICIILQHTHIPTHTHADAYIYIYHLYIINYNYNILPVVPHKAVAEVSKIGNL